MLSRTWSIILCCFLLALPACGPRDEVPLDEVAETREPLSEVAKAELKESIIRAAGMVVSSQGVSFVARFEGLSLRLYNDPAGHCTIGYGHLVHRGHCDGSESAEFRTGITSARALDLLDGDLLGSPTSAINSLMKVSLNQSQFDALASFTFNVGATNFQTSDLLKYLNMRRYDLVPSELDRWVYAGGVKLPGLVARRHAEGVLFTTGKY